MTGACQLQSVHPLKRGVLGQLDVLGVAPLSPPSTCGEIQRQRFAIPILVGESSCSRLAFGIKEEGWLRVASISLLRLLEPDIWSQGILHGTGQVGAS